MNIRKFFGFKPRVGDKITAGLDFGVHFAGVVTVDNSGNKDMPHYIADGQTFVSNMWKGEIVNDETGIIIPASLASIL